MNSGVPRLQMIVYRLQPAQPVLQRHSQCCSGIALLHRHSPCCSSTASVAAAQHVLQRYIACCSCTAHVAAAHPVLQLHNPCHIGTARVAAAQPVLQQHSPCCCGTARASVTKPLFSTIVAAVKSSSSCTTRVVACPAVMARFLLVVWALS